MSYQVETVILEELVSKTHQYSQITKVFGFPEIEHALSKVEKEVTKGVTEYFVCLNAYF